MSQESLRWTCLKCHAHSLKCALRKLNPSVMHTGKESNNLVTLFSKTVFVWSSHFEVDLTLAVNGSRCTDFTRLWFLQCKRISNALQQRKWRTCPLIATLIDISFSVKVDEAEFPPTEEFFSLLFICRMTWLSHWVGCVFSIFYPSSVSH